MDNKRHHIIPYVIFMVLLLHSIATFLVYNLGRDPLVSSIFSGLLLIVLFGFIMVNLQEIYLGRTGFCIKLILPWIFFMWLTSAGLLTRYPFRETLRAVCFQSGPLLMFLCFFIQGKNCTARNFKANQRLFFILTLVTVFYFSHELVMGQKYSADFFAIGHVLYLTMLLPWISLLNNKILKYILFASLSGLALFSMKRSALLQISVGGFFYVLIQNMIVEQRKRILYFFLTPFVLLGLYLIISYVDTSTSGALFERFRSFQVDRGSGRLWIWADLWEQYKTWPLINRVVGKGYYITRELLWKYEAHNDFIEALLAYGVIGFLANIFFSIYLSIKAAGMVLRRHPYAASFVFGVISFLIVSMVSYNLYAMIWSLYLLAFLGYICGIYQQEIHICTFYDELTTTDPNSPDEEDWFYSDQYPLEIR